MLGYCKVVYRGAARIHGGEVSLTLGTHGLQAEFPTVWFPD
jgi:hypothetical protein